VEASGIAAVGTLGLLVRAAKEGILAKEQALNAIKGLAETNFRLSKAVVEKAIALISSAPPFFHEGGTSKRSAIGYTQKALASCMDSKAGNIAADPVAAELLSDSEGCARPAEEVCYKGSCL